jgi:hypothetical protein
VREVHVEAAERKFADADHRLNAVLDCERKLADAKAQVAAAIAQYDAVGIR